MTPADVLASFVEDSEAFRAHVLAMVPESEAACEECDGRGSYVAPRYAGHGTVRDQRYICGACGGSGSVDVDREAVAETMVLDVVEWLNGGGK